VKNGKMVQFGVTARLAAGRPQMGAGRQLARTEGSRAAIVLSSIKHPARRIDDERNDQRFAIRHHLHASVAPGH
jgi:hypothetical protein